jgi:hypothetical protein
MCSAESLFIQFDAKENDTTCRFIFSDERNSFDSLSTERIIFSAERLGNRSVLTVSVRF